MELYFSHSYRDVIINSYFVKELAGCGFRLLADQKSPVWCVAKLERYLGELPGFLSIIPRRRTDDGSVTYSPYIGHELSLARRSRVPRLLFVDDQVLARHRAQFPLDAVPFVADAPARDRMRHAKQIQAFKEQLGAYGARPPRMFVDRLATVVAAGGKIIAEAADTVADILSANGFDVKMLRGRQALAGFEDVALFETLLSSELCVFLLDAKLSPADVLMGMAHAHAIPSMRLQYDRTATQCESTLSGRVPWARTADLVGEFTRQLEGFRRGFVEAVSLAENSTAADAVRTIGTTLWTPTPQQLWAFDDPPSLRHHLAPLHPFVLDEVERVNGLHGTTLAARSGRAQELEICHELFRQLKRLHFAYELEPQSPTPGQQAIRTPGDISSSRAATCIDAACLFASLLTAAGLKPVIVLLDHGQYGHALVGYRAPTAPAWAAAPALGDVRAAVSLQDLVLFEATGVVESEQPVGAETSEERQFGGRMLDFLTARRAAERMIESNVRLRAAIDLSSRT